MWHFARQLPADEWQAWLWEAWRFVKQIFVLLIVGVFIVGMVRQVIRPEWIEAVAGSNTVLANAVAVGFGVFMYFPTLVEVPVARMFLDLGMHPGPLLAYLMADPELSLQSMLMVAAVIGRTKTAAYVGLVALFSICAGFIYGTWIDGAGTSIHRNGPGAFFAGCGDHFLLVARTRRGSAPGLMSFPHFSGDFTHVDHQDPRLWLRQLQEARSRRREAATQANVAAEFVQGQRHERDHGL